MFTDLYSFVPDPWKFYIDEADLLPIIERLNKHGLSDVLPYKHDIFDCLRLTDPNDVRAVIIGEPTPQKELASGIAYSVPFEYRFTEIYKRIPHPPMQTIVHSYISSFIDGFDDSTLSDACKRGILFINYPLTCSSKNKRAHIGYGWDKIIKRLLERLLYRGSPLVLVAWNYEAFKIYSSLVSPWFPDQHGLVYTSPLFKDIQLIVSGPPHGNIYGDNDEPLYAKYKTIASRIPFGSSVHSSILKRIVKSAI